MRAREGYSYSSRPICLSVVFLSVCHALIGRLLMITVDLGMNLL